MGLRVKGVSVAGEQRWWASSQLVAGVFEGGGAKGLAYLGALRALTGRGVWFSHVGGASAGALTAALIASGMTVDEIERQTPIGLSTLGRHWRRDHRAVDTLRGLRRLHAGRGLLPADGLRTWLEGCLVRQLEELGAPRPEDAKGYVTFAELFAATKIELDVVAANISLRRLMVFSHWSTPDTAVTDAVMASAAIPGALIERTTANRLPEILETGPSPEWPMMSETTIATARPARH